MMRLIKFKTFFRDPWWAVGCTLHYVNTRLENCDLMGYCAVSSGNSLQMFRDNQSAPSSRIKPTDRLYRNVCKELPQLTPQSPYERSSCLLRGISLQTVNTCLAVELRFWQMRMGTAVVLDCNVPPSVNNCRRFYGQETTHPSGFMRSKRWQKTAQWLQTLLATDCQ